MRRFVGWLMVVLMIVSPTMMLTGCGDKAYVANMKYREHKALYQSQGRANAMSAITTAIQAIIKTVEGDYATQKEKEASEKKESFTSKLNATGNDFAVAVLGDIVVHITDRHAEAEMMRARAEAIRYLEPIVAQIYKETEEEIGTPPTSMHVAMKFVENLPFLATVYGMYKLGTAGIENAGNKVINNLDNGSSQTGQQTGTGNTGPTTTNTNTDSNNMYGEAPATTEE